MTPTPAKPEGAPARSAWTAFLAADLLEELAIAIAMLLFGVGFWNFWRPGSFLVPAGILLWLFLPTRRAFIVRPAPPADSTPAKRKPAA